MRADEVAYWDKVASTRDNVWKRRAIAHRMFEKEWIGKRVLEIGTGHGTVAAALHVIHLGNFKYVGTDVSPKYCQMNKENFDINVVNTDILDLPRVEGGFTRVIALDSLEHVSLEDREAGYKAIGDRLADEADMIINMPLSPTKHDLKFDHKFDFEDISNLCRLADMRLTKYEEYGVDVPSGRLHYGWVELKRGKF
jgi:cyclopropane fatty-acyl-phospholipid synthase-like methyltransferase